MTTTNATPATFTAEFNWTGDMIRIITPETTLFINQERYDDVAFDDDEQSCYDRFADVRAGRPVFFAPLSAADLDLWRSIHAKLTPAGVSPSHEVPTLAMIAPPAPVVEPPPAPIVVDVVPTPAPIVVDVEPTGEAGEAGAEKRRVKFGQFIHEEYRKATRGFGIDALEQQITHLQAIADRAGEEVSFLTYDIPTIIRREIVDPCDYLWLFGFRHTESLWVIPNKNLPRLQRLFDLWDEANARHEGEMVRDGWRMVPVQVKYAHEEVSFRAVGRVRQMAQDALDTVLRDAHASLVGAIGDADVAMQAALGAPLEDGKERTAKDLERLQAKRDNAIRAALVSAAELLRRSVAAAVEYDNTEKLADLLLGLRNAIAARKEAFNVEMRARKGKLAVV